MENKNIQGKNEKILSVLKTQGPSLPVHISRNIEIDMIFASAFLSELVSNKEVRVSNMKVGGSPIYYIPGQEEQLEKYYKYLNGKEKEAFLLLKEKKVLEDKNQEPPIRVALRNIKDFAYHFYIDQEGYQKLFWRLHTIPEEKARKIVKGEENIENDEKSKIEEKREKINLIEKIGKERENKPDRKNITVEKNDDEVNYEEGNDEKSFESEKKSGNSEKNQEVRGNGQEEKEEKEEEQLLAIDENKKGNKKSDLVNEKVLTFFKEKNIEMIEEKEDKKHSYMATIKTYSNLGEIKFLCVVRDKKNISGDDIMIASQKAQNLKKPLLLITDEKSKISNDAKKFLEKNKGLIKLKKL